MIRTFYVVALIVSTTALWAGELTIEPYTFEPRRGEPVEAERGRFHVPENRDDPDSRMIEMSFVRFPSTSDKPGNPIVYLAGGPGGSGVATARGRRFPLFMKLREVADVIAFDQRGTGWSNAIPRCERDASLVGLLEPMTRDAWLRAYQTLASECADFWRAQGVDLNGYDSARSAADLEDLRRVLGVEQIDLWGISYGTHLALAALRQHPTSFGRVVLASIEGPDDTVKLPSRTDAFLEHLSSLVRQDPELSKEIPDLVALMRTVLDKLDAEPARIKVPNRFTGEVVNLVIDKLTVQALTGYLIKNPDTIATLPRAYWAMSQGDYTALAPYLVRFKSLRSMGGMSEAMDAASGMSAARHKRIEEERATAVLGDALNFPGVELAEALGIETLPSTFRAPLQSSVPTLFLSGTLDGRTYVDAAREVAAGFDHGVHVIVENAGHDLFMSDEEIGRRIAEFFATGTTSQTPITLPPIRFAHP
ncbi:MAG: alpha/beta fold hydrolase [Acidobacteriota bacterium]